MAAPSENHEMDYFVAAVTTNIPCENNTDHLDTKVVHILFIYSTLFSVKYGFYVPWICAFFDFTYVVSVRQNLLREQS